MRPWLQERGAEWDGALGPALAPASVRLKQRSTEGKQAGAYNQKAALPPVVSYGLSPDEHFAQSLQVGQTLLPTEYPAILDADLHFAADICRSHRGHLRVLRARALGMLRELHRRWQPVTRRLRQFQPQGIRQVTAKRDLGFTSLLIVLSSWPDITYPYGLITGLPAVGYAPCYGIFPELKVDPIPFDEVMGDWQNHNYDILSSLRPGPDDEFLLQQSCVDADKGFCTYPMTQAELRSALRGEPFRLIPRCVITQSSGKQRVIDDAFRGGQSGTSRDSNKLVLCSPLRPAQHVQALLQGMTPAELTAARATDSLESGGEDWPDAYRHSPMSRFEASHCIVVWWHIHWGAPAFQIYSGLLFGLPLAVTSFNRYSRLSESLGRRFLYVLVSMYFDDAHLTDWSSSRGSGQAGFEALNELLGTPFAADKRQPMSDMGVFLGLEHHFKDTLSTGNVEFWVKDKLVSKLSGLISSSLQAGSLPPGVASKIYGLANFFEQGVFGRVGAGGLHAIKERQYERSSALSKDVLQCFQILKSVLQFQPRRQFPVLGLPHHRFCAASDAALESPGQGTGGFLIVWFRNQLEKREAFLADIPPEVYQLWTPGDKKIAQLELSQVLYSLVARPSEFRGRRGVWFIDNIAALMALIRGRSDSPDLERMANLIHLACFALRTWIYWEYIPSKSNWADAISRLGMEDPCHSANQFKLFRVSFPFFLWKLPFSAVILVFEML